MEGTTQHKAVRTDNRNRIYLYIILAVLALAVVFLLVKLLMGNREINARLLRNEIFLNENLVYTDNTPGSEEWKWEFGDGSRSKEQSGYYRFKEAGTYLVRLTVDQSLQQQFAVVVKDTVPLALTDSIRISGPTAGVTGMQLRLEAEGDANIFEWSFGETGRVDAKGRNAYYTYRSPGRYTVALQTDKSPVPVYTVLNITEPVTDIGLVDPNAGGQALMDDFKTRLQAIANGANFNTHYYYLVRKYLCNGEKTTAQAEDETGKKNTDFYSYCIGLTFSKNVVIDEVSLTLAPSRCVSLVQVKQHRRQ
ncbi:PKD domain-containing protein [Chitinophaga sp. GCM10012297]|uniref:PKD domain-containing protein n=1 Tax=Chitinophaga chungangae TaxID=2821488 RepID=A0ABS3YGJ3_9BACT|nr:PKD domain-containing protein [Chitinophaga chungangae]MBO9153812.1 PKD domain-containing protein [Chitinophaga chungangae]